MTEAKIVGDRIQSGSSRSVFNSPARLDALSTFHVHANGRLFPHALVHEAHQWLCKLRELHCTLGIVEGPPRAYKVEAIKYKEINRWSKQLT